MRMIRNVTRFVSNSIASSRNMYAKQQATDEISEMLFNVHMRVCSKTVLNAVKSFPSIVHVFIKLILTES